MSIIRNTLLSNSIYTISTLDANSSTSHSSKANLLHQIFVSGSELENFVFDPLSQLDQTKVYSPNKQPIDLKKDAFTQVVEEKKIDEVPSQNSQESDLKHMFISADGDELKFHALLGQGSFGYVFHGELQLENSYSKQKVAIKVNKNGESEKAHSRLKSLIFDEAILVQKIQTKTSTSQSDSFIVEYLMHGSLNPEQNFFVMPLYHGDLFHLRRKNPTLFQSLEAIRDLAHQLFSALHVLRSFDPVIVHCDIKPSNILIEQYSPIKIRLSDFGNSNEGSSTNLERDYIVTRWYRAPEIVLGLPYGPAIDVWSAACTLFEAYSGSVLFQADTNYHLIHLQRGLLPKMSKQFYEKNLKGKSSLNLMTKPYYASKDLFAKKFPNVLGEPETAIVEKRKALKQLLEKSLTWDQNERITPEEALNHYFITNDLPTPTHFSKNLDITPRSSTSSGNREEKNGS
ncbi:MAG: serine/threonine-protein kinase, partial [Chlamydiae bacterium]|nr:serine/threonine-protein kinase [Chlamydiota bacterium]